MRGLKIPAQKPNRADVAAAAVILLLAAGLVVGLVLAVRGADALQAVVYLDGEAVFRGDLAEDGEYTVQGRYHNRVCIRDGAVWIEEADCPGEDCVHQGRISRAGQSIVCLPNHLVVAVEGRNGVDVVTK